MSATLRHNIQIEPSPKVTNKSMSLGLNLHDYCSSPPATHCLLPWTIGVTPSAHPTPYCRSPPATRRACGRGARDLFTRKISGRTRSALLKLVPSIQVEINGPGDQKVHFVRILNSSSADFTRWLELTHGIKGGSGPRIVSRVRCTTAACRG